MPAQYSAPMSPAPVVATSLPRLFLLRFFALLSYSMTYIAVPALLFKGTRSTTIAGLALLVEGVLRAAVSLMARRVHGRLGSRRALLLAEGMRLAGGGALLVCLWHFNVALLVAASCIYQFGYLIIALEQELRCGQLGERTLLGQSTFRVAEITVLLPVLAAALAFSGWKVPLLPLVGLGCAASVVHLGLSRWWLKSNIGEGVRSGHAWRGLRYLFGSPALRSGLVASTLAFSVFTLALSAAPFLLQGHTLLGHDLTRQAGLSLFKVTAALAALVFTAGMTWLLRTRCANVALLGAGVAAPLFLAVSQTLNSNAAVVLALASAPAMALAVLMALRSRRQQQLSAEYRDDATAAYLAVECLSMSIAGFVLATGSLLSCMALFALALSILLWPWADDNRPFALTSSAP